MKRTIITTAVILMTTAATYAQSELKGNWQFKEQQSIEGNLYSNGSPKSVKIDGLTFEKVSAGPDGDVTTKETVSLEKPTEALTASNKRKVITFKKEGDKYIEYVTIYNSTDPKKYDRKQTDTWYIENGQLILDRKDENLINGETWESKATYTKIAQ